MYIKDLVILCFIASHLYYCNFLYIQYNFPICIAWSNNIGPPSCGLTTQRRGQTQCVLDGNQGLPKCFWQIVRQLNRRKQYYTQMVPSAGGELQTSTQNIVRQWKEYLKDRLNPTDMDGWRGQLGHHWGEVMEIVKPLLLKALDVLWLTPTTCLWKVETVSLNWQTWVVVPLFKKGDWRALTSVMGDHTSQPPQKGLCQGAGEDSPPISCVLDPGGAMQF